MKHISKLTLVSAIMLATTAISLAETIRIRKNEVINIVMDDTLSVSDTRSGDRFMAWIDERDFPRGTQLLGEVRRVDRRRENASIELEFQTIRFPDGTRKSIDAVPVSLSSGRYDRNRNGRLEARRSRGNNSTVVAGTVGGYILGKAIGKPAEGAFWGTVAGILVAGLDKGGHGVYFRNGDRMGAQFERDFSVNVRNDWDNRYRREDPWNDRMGNRHDGDDYDQGDYQNRRGDRNDDENWKRNGSRSLDYDIQYRKRSLEFDRGEEPYYSGSVLMVPLNQTASLIGLSVDAREQNDRILVEDDENSATLELSSKQFRLNGRKKELNGNIETKNGVLYVPVQFFEEMRKDELEVIKMNSR